MIGFRFAVASRVARTARISFSIVVFATGVLKVASSTSSVGGSGASDVDEQRQPEEPVLDVPASSLVLELGHRRSSLCMQASGPSMLHAIRQEYWISEHPNGVHSYRAATFRVGSRSPAMDP